jgi:signal transduction histidine kinase
VASFGPEEGGFPGAGVRAIVRSGNRVYFGSRQGLVVREGGAFHLVPELDGHPLGSVSGLLVDRRERLWVGTILNGLFRVDGDEVQHFPSDATGTMVRGFLEDERGIIWFGTRGRGLVRLENDRLDHFAMKQGMFDDIVHSVTLDDQGFLWLSSQRGLARVERSMLERSLADRHTTPTYRSFGIHEGLRTEDTSGTTQPASWTMRDGSIWFATLAGVAIIQPRSLDRSRTPPRVIIEDVLADTVELREPGRIPAGTRNLAIRYTATSLIGGARNRFRYRLHGIDDDFVDAGTRREAFYNDIPPGTYNFQVLAADAENVWNEEGATVTLTFEPFFYQTRLFFWSVVASLILSLLAGDRYRLRSVRRRQVQLKEEVDERTREVSLQKSLIEEQAGELRLLNEAKSRFFANVTHELRTPLTLMIAPLEDWLGRGEAEQVPATRPISTALTSARRMNQLVDELMSIAKIESGAARLILRRDDIVAFLDRSWQGFVPIAESRDIHFTLHGPPDEILVDFDATQLRFAIDNLLQNAFKFTSRGGEIDLEIGAKAADEGSWVRFTVRDSGCGIAPEHR